MKTVLAYFRQQLQSLKGWWHQRSETTRSLPHHLWQAVKNFSRRGGRHSAALAYYSVFSVFPLTLLLAVAVSGLVGPAVAQEQIASGLELFLPAQTVNLLQTNLSEALKQSGSFGLVALLGLLWSALGLFTNLSTSLDLIFDVSEGRSMWRQRLLAFSMTIILIILIVSSFVASGILLLISAFLLDSSVWMTIAITFLPLGLNMVIFALLFHYVPARRVSWDAVWPAAVFGAVGWELAKNAFVWYLNNFANFAVVYGGIATVIVLMFWAYLLAMILLISAEFCAELDEWITENQQPENPEQLPEGDFPRLPSEISRHFD